MVTENLIALFPASEDFGITTVLAEAGSKRTVHNSERRIGSYFF
jgi:hypothetical protein